MPALPVQPRCLFKDVTMLLSLGEDAGAHRAEACCHHTVISSKGMKGQALSYCGPCAMQENVLMFERIKETQDWSNFNVSTAQDLQSGVDKLLQEHQGTLISHWDKRQARLLVHSNSRSNSLGGSICRAFWGWQLRRLWTVLRPQH